MHPYVIDRIVQERHDELTRLARADRVAALARRHLASGAGPGPGATPARPTRPSRRAVAAAVVARLGRAMPVAPRPRAGADLRPCLGPCPPAS